MALCLHVFNVNLSSTPLQMADVRRQRSLASVDLFLKSAMTQLQVLLTESPKDTPTGAASVVQDTLTENS